MEHIIWGAEKEHRIECLEAEIRKLRQALRIVADAAIAGQDDIVPLSMAAKNLLDE